MASPDSESVLNHKKFPTVKKKLERLKSNILLINVLLNFLVNILNLLLSTGLYFKK